MSTELPLSPSSSFAQTTPTQSAPPPEIESTLSRLSGYRNVRGVMILTRPSPVAPWSASTAKEGPIGGIVQSTGTVFEGESGRKYAKAVENVAWSVGRAVEECDEGDELRLMRIRTKRHELIITPDEKYLLVVLQDPGQ
ncbi:hypothetical protein IAR55_006758 [Kwoniella newhampshirensis]|uniref:Roadblock/LAMTOR2 domain-containing protein n=1 Tax=Kwoniella newhampshirensis TaxID=1651941 RepID=A0AAW0YT85_9TREE